jgi:hypothetical protein
MRFKAIKLVGILVLAGLIWVGVMPQAMAQSCATKGTTHIIKSCDDNSGKSECKPDDWHTFNYYCMNGCQGIVENKICGYVGNECDVIPGNPSYVWIPCETIDGSCESTAPACGGTCPGGSYCRAKVSDPNQCVCATGGGCVSGYDFECRSSCSSGGWSPGGNLSCDSSA